MTKPLAKTKYEKKNILESGDYVAKDDGSLWIEYSGVLVHVTKPYKEKRVLVELFRDDQDVEDDFVIDSCTCEPRRRKKK